MDPTVVEGFFNLVAMAVSRREPNISVELPTIEDLQAEVQGLYTPAPVEEDSAVGEISHKSPESSEKAQAIATGCVPCTPPTSLIWANPKIMSIEQAAGQSIIDANGQPSEVISLMERHYKGDLIKLIVPGQNEPILLTPEHPVLAIKATGCKLNRGQTLCFPKENPKCFDCPHEYKPRWIPAGELSATGKKNVFSKHIALMPRITNCIDIPVIDSQSIARVKAPYLRNHIKNKVSVDENFMKLLGYYLAEGSVIFGVRGALVRFDFGQNEELLVNETISLLNEVFGLHAKSVLEKSTSRVYVSSVALGQFLTNLVGSGSHQKHIPMWIINLPTNKLLALLQGYWNGDGSCGISYSREVMSASTSSGQLAYALRLILHKLGILHHLGRHKTQRSVINGREIKSGLDQWIVQINSNAAAKLKAAWGLPSNYHFVQSSQLGIDDKWVYLPIKKVTRIPYDGIVMNLETKSQTYCINGVIVHNCSIGHLGTCSGLLNEAMRFARSDGIQSEEVISRCNMCLDELNALERVDLRPELIHGLPDWEKALAEKALNLSRSLRHDLEGLSSTDALEGITARTQGTRQEIGSAWFRERLSRMSPEQRQMVEEKLKGKFSLDQAKKVAAAEAAKEVEARWTSQ